MTEYVTVQDPDKSQLLYLPSQPCSIPLSDADRACIKILEAKMIEEGDNVLGIAAVQIGYPKQIFVIRHKDENLFFVNPQIISKSREFTKKTEGCLSIPNFGGIPKRPKSVTVRYLDVNEKIQERTFTGLSSRIICHEMDHLNGILITHHMEAKIKKEEARKKQNKNRRVAKRRAKNKKSRKNKRC